MHVHLGSSPDDPCPPWWPWWWPPPPPALDLDGEAGVERELFMVLRLRREWRREASWKETRKLIVNKCSEVQLWLPPPALELDGKAGMVLELFFVLVLRRECRREAS